MTLTSQLLHYLPVLDKSHGALAVLDRTPALSESPVL